MESSDADNNPREENCEIYKLSMVGTHQHASPSSLEHLSTHVTPKDILRGR
jgi:hypothetical protein